MKQRDKSESPAPLAAIPPGAGVVVGAVDTAEGLIDAPVKRGRSLFEKLSFQFNAQDEQESLENLRQWSNARLEYWIEQRRHKEYELLDKFSGGDTNQLHPYQSRRIESIRFQIRRGEQVLSERADTQVAATEPPDPPSVPATVRQMPLAEILDKKAISRHRHALCDAYKDECAAEGITVTNVMIARAAYPKSKDPKTVIKKWLAGDRRYGEAYDASFGRVFTEKPHLPKSANASIAG
jgi:hypothetical protein